MFVLYRQTIKLNRNDDVNIVAIYNTAEEASMNLSYFSKLHTAGTVVFSVQFVETSP